MKKSEAREILEVDLHASPKDIKNSFRQKCMESHPDKGGTQLKFELIKIAYDTLNGSSATSVNMAMAYTEATSAFEAVLSNVRNPLTVDLIYRSIELINKTITEYTSRINSLKLEKINLNNIIPRLFTSEANSVLIDTLLIKLESLDDSIVDLEQQIDTLNMAITILKKHRYNYDEPASRFDGSISFNIIARR